MSAEATDRPPAVPPEPDAAIVPDPPVAVVDGDALEDARRDPRVQAFLHDADAYLAELKRLGRDL